VRASICFYGDDLTGSTDALANFARWGLDARLVLGPAAVGGLSGAPDVVGVAGTARSLPAGELAMSVSAALDALAPLQPEVVQYKVCSTFDSSPELGSIGRACEVALGRFGPQAVPVVAAQPELGRWTLFSNHFARGFDGQVHRLDRHPTMSAHPVTPMREADLRLVLEAQSPGLSVRGLHRDELGSYLEVSRRHKGPVVLDALDNEDLRLIGRLVRAQGAERPVFAVGSGGLSYGLGSTFGRPETAATPAGDAGPVLALSGSCSPDTARQVQAAAVAGWELVGLQDAGAEGAAELASAALARGRSVVVYSSLGPPAEGADAPGLGHRLGQVASWVLASGLFQRLLVAGGDTSGAVMEAIGAEELEYVAMVGRREEGGTCALCRVRSSAPGRAGLQVVLKGGQVGGLRFFEHVRSGVAG
jgi:uncharacterized protein YgbK (DUF1537 family)